jgi:hypothetical protein
LNEEHLTQQHKAGEGWKPKPKKNHPKSTTGVIPRRQHRNNTMPSCEPAPTSAPSTGCLLLLSYGWTSTELVYGFTSVTNYVKK